MISLFILLISAQCLSAMSDDSTKKVVLETIDFFDHAAYEAYPMLFEKLRGQIQKLSHEARRASVGDLEALADSIVTKAPSKAVIYGDLLSRFSITQGPALLLVASLRDYCTVSELDCSFRVAATAISITLGGISIVSGWGSEPRKALFAYTISDKIAKLALAIKNNQAIGDSGIVA